MPEPPAVAADADADAPPEAGTLPDAAADAATGDETAGVEAPSDTGAGPAGRKNRYHTPAAPARTTATASSTTTAVLPEVVRWGTVIECSAARPRRAARHGDCARGGVRPCEQADLR